MIHRHDFEEAQRRFTQPDRQVSKVKGVDESTFMEIVYGFTLVESKCRKCGMIKFIQMPGDQTREERNE